MIRLMYGNPGSGKTASMAREIALGLHGRDTYTNISMPKCDRAVKIKNEMIVKRAVVGMTKPKTGSPQEIVELSLNAEYWRNIGRPINVCIDECHNLLNPRRAMSKINIIVTDWLALIRKTLGGGDLGYGELVLITQLERRVDPIARDMATQVRFHRCHYTLTCSKCHTHRREHNDMPDIVRVCPKCRRSLKKWGHRIEVWYFASNNHFLSWYEGGASTFYRHLYINDIEDYFGSYDTLQWEDLLSAYQ